MFADINGARIHYERSGAGVPLILLHAGIADSRMWEPQVAAFAQHFDVITADVRGYGESELPAAEWSPHGDVLGLMDRLHLGEIADRRARRVRLEEAEARGIDVDAAIRALHRQHLTVDCGPVD